MLPQTGETFMIKNCFWHRSSSAPSRPPSRAATIDPTHAIALTPDQIQWKKGEASDTGLADRRSSTSPAPAWS